jgi:hypothetical protein
MAPDLKRGLGHWSFELPLFCLICQRVGKIPHPFAKREGMGHHLVPDPAYPQFAILNSPFSILHSFPDTLPHRSGHHTIPHHGVAPTDVRS